MRVDLKKFLFWGVENERKKFFKEAQKYGIIQFIPESTATVKGSSAADVHNLSSAIKILRGLPPKEQEETDEYALAESIATKIRQLHDHLEKLAEEERVIHLEKSRVSIYGAFSRQHLQEI